jgi:hypothetical protein
VRIGRSSLLKRGSSRSRDGRGGRPRSARIAGTGALACATHRGQRAGDDEADAKARPRAAAAAANVEAVLTPSGGHGLSLLSTPGVGIVSGRGLEAERFRAMVETAAACSTEAFRNARTTGNTRRDLSGGPMPRAPRRNGEKARSRPFRLRDSVWF